MVHSSNIASVPTDKPRLKASLLCDTSGGTGSSAEATVSIDVTQPGPIEEHAATALRLEVPRPESQPCGKAGRFVCSVYYVCTVP